jgi:hypothetical protein
MRAREGDRYEMTGDGNEGVVLEITNVSSEIVEAEVIFPEHVVQQFDNLHEGTPAQSYDVPDPELGGEWELKFASDTMARFEGTAPRKQFENEFLTDNRLKKI